MEISTSHANQVREASPTSSMAGLLFRGSTQFHRAHTEYDGTLVLTLATDQEADCFNASALQGTAHQGR